MKDSLELKYYDDLSSTYHDVWKQPIQVYHHKVESEIVQGYINKNYKIAVIGCGGGREFEYLLKDGVEIIGIDFSIQMLKQAMQRIQKSIEIEKELSKFKINLIGADATNLPIENNQFDVVMSMASFNYFPKYEEAFAEMVRVAKPGGKIILSVINKYELAVLLKGVPIKTEIISFLLKTFKDNNKVNNEFRKLFDTNDLRVMYRNNNLENIEIYGIRLIADLIPQKFNTQKKYFPVTNDLLKKIEIFDSFFLHFNIIKRFARFILIIGEKKI